MSRHPSLTVVVLNAVTEGLLIQLTSDEAAYVAASREKRSTFEQKKKSYWSERSSPTKLWRSLTALLQRDERTANAIKPTCNDADDLLHFFEEKVKAVRASTEGYQPPTTTSSSLSSQSAPADGSLSVLSPCSEEEVRRLIMQSPTKSCALDPISTFVLKEMVDVLLPYLTAMVNTSLREGRLPSSHKHAVVTPLLNKTGLDPDELKNYRPVSNLTFVSKLAERVVSARLVSHLNAHG